MDTINTIISTCLSIQPVPGLHFAFTTLQWVVATVRQIQDSKEQIETLIMALAQLMRTINEQYKKGKLIEDDTKDALKGLERLINDVRAFIDTQVKNSAFIQLISCSKRLSTIDTFQRRLTMSINAFQVAALLDTQNLIHLNEQARMNDQQRLYKMLSNLEANHRLLVNALDINNNEPLAMMAALQRRIDELSGDSKRVNLTRFYTTSLQYLATTSGRSVETTPWTITSFDVEYGPQIGAGGFGTVFRGKWNEVDVAIKVMRNSADAIPKALIVRREVDAWSRLRHPHILQFLGANILDNKPFIVTPYLSRGNAAEYTLRNPQCNRLEIIHHICLGLTYLHGQRIVHGDIKGTNVLIDDSGKGVLCDFGLARIKADVNSRTIHTKENFEKQMGSQNWMAPELFQGSSLRISCDIYSLGMTIYELYAGEVPLSNIHPVRLQEAVIHGTRPHRPDELDAPQLTDQVWTMAQNCWVKSPSDRPVADALCRDIQYMLDTRRRSVQNGPISPLRQAVVNMPTPNLPPRVEIARNISVNARVTNSAPVPIMMHTPTSQSGRIRIMDASLPTKRPYKRCLYLKKKPDANIISAALGDNGKVLLTGYDDGTLRTWDAIKGVCKRDYPVGSNNLVTEVAFSPTTSIRYAATSMDARRNMTSVYVVMKDKTLTCLQPEFYNISNLTILSDDTILGVECQGNEACLILWKRVKSGRGISWANGMRLPLLGLDALSETLLGCGFVISPDGKKIWTGNTSRSIFTSFVETGQQDHRPLHMGTDNQLTSGPIQIQNEQTPPFYTAPNTASSASDGGGRGSPLVHLSCAPDGQKIAISYASGEILVLDLRSKKVKTVRGAACSSNLQSPSLHGRRVPPVIFSSDGSRIIYPSNTEQKTIIIQDVATNVILDSVYLGDCPQGNDISFISVTPNFKHITVSFVQYTQALVFIWD